MIGPRIEVIPEVINKYCDKCMFTMSKAEDFPKCSYGIYRIHPLIGKKYIGTDYNTPSWCPVGNL